MITGLTIIRNAIINGYPIVETIKTLQAICDEVIVLDGMSDDGTTDILKKLNVKIYSDEWQPSSEGLEFARITNLGLSRCSGDYIMYLQADEVIHEQDFDKIKELINQNVDAIACEFIHLRYDLLYKIKNGDAYQSAIRIIKNRPGMLSHSDAYTFINYENPIIPSYNNITIFHAGYVFLLNILQKMINHANRYYIDNSNYQQRATIAQDLLNKINQGIIVTPTEANSALEPYYYIVPHNLDLPLILKPHINALIYNPEINLDKPTETAPNNTITTDKTT